MIVLRKQFAASTVKQQNWFWRRNTGPRQIKHNDRAAIIVGLFAFALGSPFRFASRAADGRSFPPSGW